MASSKISLNIRDLVEAKLFLYELVELRDWLVEREEAFKLGVAFDGEYELREARVRLERALLRFSVVGGGSGSTP